MEHILCIRLSRFFEGLLENKADNIALNWPIVQKQILIFNKNKCNLQRHPRTKMYTLPFPTLKHIQCNPDFLFNFGFPDWINGSVQVSDFEHFDPMLASSLSLKKCFIPWNLYQELPQEISQGFAPLLQAAVPGVY